MREPIIIGLDDSPIIFTIKGVDWSFNPDPPTDFLIRTMKVAQSLQAEQWDEFAQMGALLAEQLTDPDQRELWAKHEFGVATINTVLVQYMEEVNNLPTQPSSDSGKPRGGVGRK